MSVDPKDLFPLDGAPTDRLPVDLLPAAAAERLPFSFATPSFDILVVSTFGDPDFVLWNDGAGGFVFGDVSSDEVWGYANDVVLGDLNDDGLLDAFIITEAYQSIVLFNNGDETFTATGVGDFPARSRGVDLGDIDGDGDLDAYVTNTGFLSQMLINDGDGNFTVSNDFDVRTQAHDAEFGDLDGDGDLDVFVGIWGNRNRVLINDGSGDFAARTILNDQLLNSVSVSLGDLDGDGDLDAFTASFPGVDQFFFNDGNANFEMRLAPDGYSNSQDAQIGDLDGDGDLDVMIVGGDDYGLDEMRILLNDGSGNFSVSPYSLELPDVGTDLALADLDADGDLDAYVTHFNTVDSLLINDGSGAFSYSGVAGTDFISSGVAIGDLNGDGDILLPDPSLADVFEIV